MDDLITQAVLLIFGGALAGGLLGSGFAWLQRQRGVGGDTFVQGLALGVSVFAAATCYGAGNIGWATWQQQRGMAQVQGRLLEHVEETSVDARTRRSTTLRAPRVAFTAADGQRYTVKGLGGSQPDKQVGDAVPVLYQPANPRAAVVADFQNQWGAFWGLSAFAGFGLMAALFFTATAWREAAERRPRPRTSKRPAAAATAWQRWRGRHGARFERSFTAAAGLTLVMSLLLAAFDVADNLARSISVALAGIASAMFCYIVATMCSARASGMALGILSILTAGFSFFAFGLWMLSAP